LGQRKHEGKIMKVAWHGVFPALTTQFHRDQSLDVDATARHLDLLINSGIDGVIVLGSVGENTAMDHEEKLRVLRAAVETARGRIPVLSGVAECSTAQACRYARTAEQLGADGLMVLPAMVYKADARETLAHFRAVARATPLPVMIYNNPVSYYVDCTPEMFVELRDE
jgi:1-pyrroline-4-hydroxy-2-carboxylate deaminase